MSIQWKGVMPAVTTKFTADDKLDFRMFEVNLKAQLEAGVEGIILGGTLGEASTLLEDEKRELGLGTNIMTDDKYTLYQKSGDSMGQSSIICYNRAKNWGIIILLNQRNSKMRNNLLDTIYDTVLK